MVNGLKILLVEDLEINQKLVVEMLKKIGYQTDIAENGKKAIEKCQDNYYDLIFMDCQMPVMDGYEATRIIKNDSAITKKPIIIAMTANAMDGEREICLNSGMDDYLSKPISIKKIDEIIKKWLIKNK